MCTANAQHRQAHTHTHSHTYTAEHADTNNNMQQQQQPEQARKQRQPFFQILEVCLILFVHKTLKGPAGQEKKSSVPEVTASYLQKCSENKTIPTQTCWTHKTNRHLSLGWMVVKGSVQPNYKASCLPPRGIDPSRIYSVSSCLHLNGWTFSL